MNCSLFRRHVDALLDGEVDPATQIEFERHAAMCTGCQEHLAFERSFKNRVKTALAPGLAPADLRARLAESMSKVEAAPAHVHPMAPRAVPLNKRYSWALGLAAAAALFFGFWNNNRVPGAGGNEVDAAATLPLFEDVVRLHASALPADVTQREQVPAYFRGKLDFPVQPAEFQGQNANLVGARLSNVRDRRAAAFYYDVHGNRVTMVVFAAPRRLYDDALHMKMSGREIRYRQVNGYTVPVVYNNTNGVAYALTGDLNRGELLRLVSNMRTDR